MEDNIMQKFVDILHERGYKETPIAYSYVDGHLVAVDFKKDKWLVTIQCEETEEFYNELENMEDGTEYTVDYNNYVVTGIFIQSPICDRAGFTDNDKSGIFLPAEPGDWHTHGLEYFEYCLGLQSTNLLEHELKIMKCRIETLSWAKENFVPIIEKYDYTCSFDSFFNCDENATDDTSDPTIIFNHYNDGQLYIDNDCITGKPKIVCDGIDITDDVYGKDSETVYNVLVEKVWKKNVSRYGYIWSGDPKETKYSEQEVFNLMRAIDYGDDKVKINFDIIPERCKWLVDKYKEKFGINEL